MTAITEIQILDRMDEILDGPDKWTQGVYARTADGAAISSIVSGPLDPEAASFCVYGAMFRAAADLDPSLEWNGGKLARDMTVEPLSKHLNDVSTRLNDKSLLHYNDSEAKFEDIKDVIAATRKSLEAAQ